MTITDNGRRTRTRGQLIEQARLEIGSAPLPSRTALAKSLRTHFTIASEIHELLSAERLREAARRHKARRAEAETKAPPRRVSKATVITPAAPFMTPSEPPGEAVDAALDEPLPEAVEQAPAPVAERPERRAATWPIYLLALPAFAAVWSGWVGLGGLTGFGLIQPFPGIPFLEGIELDTAITLPVGVETYAAYALYVWLSGYAPPKARRFAMWSAIGSLAFGAAGQVALHLMVAAGITVAPWQITTVVACLPVAVLGMGAALRHLVHAEEAS